MLFTAIASEQALNRYLLDPKRNERTFWKCNCPLLPSLIKTLCGLSTAHPSKTHLMPLA